MQFKASQSLAMFALFVLSTSVAQAADCNGNGIDDAIDIANGTSLDCNGNGVPDECETSSLQLLTDFDNAPLPPGVTMNMDGLWQTTTCCMPPAGSCSASGKAAYFGQCTTPWPGYSCTIYGYFGTSHLRFQNVSIPALPSHAKVSFCHALLSSGDPHEEARVVVNGTIIERYYWSDLSNPWTGRTVDLSAYAGQTVTLSFDFYHSDGIGDSRGWHLDNIYIGDAGTGETDCNDNGALDSCEIAADPGLDADGNGILDECEPCRSASYCVTSPNSVGPGATISMSGSSSVSQNDMALHATGLPPGQWGLFYYGPAQIQLPFGDGFRCVGAGGLGVFRAGMAQADANGSVSLPLDLSRMPFVFGPGQVMPDDTWNFQFWYRDPAAGGTGFNLTNALEVRFCP